MKCFIVLLLFVQLSGCGEKSKSKDVIEKEKLVASCLSSQSQCQISTTFGKFEVLFSQDQSQLSLVTDEKVESSKFESHFDQIITELPFSVVLKLIKPKKNTQKITKVSAYLEGKDMFMGKVPIFFNTKNQQNEFTANSLLASCSEDVMKWRLWLTIQVTAQENIQQNNQQVEQEINEQRFFIDFESLRR